MSAAGMLMICPFMQAGFGRYKKRCMLACLGEAARKLTLVWLLHDFTWNMWCEVVSCSCSSQPVKFFG